MEEDVGEEAQQVSNVRGRHIKKRALKNKALAILFDEKDLKDYVTGFHKRKKKRRKEAQKQQEVVERRKRLEGRKKRRLEREFVLYGGAQPPTDSAPAPNENEEYHAEDEEREPVASISGMAMYDNGDMKVTVTTSDISPSEKTQVAVSRSIRVDKKHNIPVSKSKSYKKAAKRRSLSKPQNKRNKKKGKKKNQKKR